jgi:transcriptional regulator with XRE-family HTH domain
MPDESFALRLMRAKSRMHVNQQQLANMAGIKASLISRYEVHGALPSVPVLIRLATTLNVSTDYLLGLSETM